MEGVASCDSRRPSRALAGADAQAARGRRTPRSRSSEWPRWGRTARRRCRRDRARLRQCGGSHGLRLTLPPPMRNRGTQRPVSPEARARTDPSTAGGSHRVPAPARCERLSPATVGRAAVPTRPSGPSCRHPAARSVQALTASQLGRGWRGRRSIRTAAAGRSARTSRAQTASVRAFRIVSRTSRRLSSGTGLVGADRFSNTGRPPVRRSCSRPCRMSSASTAAGRPMKTV